MSAAAPAATGEERQHLSRSIGLGRVLFQSITTMGPGASIVFGLGLIILYSGRSAPAAMLIGVVAALFLAYAIGQLATRIPSAGGLYSYVSVSLGKDFGFLVGWFYAVVYVVLASLSALNFSLVFQDFLSTYFNVTVGYRWLVVGLLLVTGILTWIGVKTSTGLTLVLGLLEVILLLIVAIVLIGKAGGRNDLSVFDPAHAAGSGSVVRSLALGVVFAFATISGFEACAPLAEETKNPRRTVTRAILASTLLIGVFYIIAMYASVVGWGAGSLHGYINSPNPWRQMGDSISGVFGLLVSLALLNSVIAGVQAGFNASSRLLFSVGRSGVAPGTLGRIDQRRKTPAVAIAAACAFAIAITLVAASIFHGAYPAFVFFLTIVTLVWIVLYGIICVACFAFYWAKARPDFSVVRHAIVPAIGLAVLGPTMYYSVQGLAYPSNDAPLVIGVWFVLGLAVLVLLRARGVDIGGERQHWLDADAIEPETEPGIDRVPDPGLAG